MTTFWGLNVIKRPEKVSVAKRGMEKMFDIMLPNHAGHHTAFAQHRLPPPDECPGRYPGITKKIFIR